VKIYGTFNIIVGSFIVIFAGFVGWFAFGPDTPDSDAVPAAVRPVNLTAAKPTDNADSRPSLTEQIADDGDLDDRLFAERQDIVEPEYVNEPFTIIELSSQISGETTNLSKTINDIDTNSDDRFNPMSFATSPSSVTSTGGSATSVTGSSLGTTTGGAASGGGSSGSGQSGSQTQTPTSQNPVSDNPTTGGGGEPTEDIIDATVTDWITKEGIRAGYLFYYTHPRYAAIMKNAGMNTVIVKGWQFYLAQMATTLKAYQTWAKTCNENGLHMIAAFNWQPQEEVFANCRPVMFADGTEGIFPCPLDEYFWREHLTNAAVKIAEISVEDSVSVIDGLFLDMEMYRTEELPHAQRSYSSTTCFCDVCFSRFINEFAGFKSLPPVRIDRRQAWLTQYGLLADYRTYQIAQVEAKAGELKSAVRAINPKLLFGVYPAITDSNWVLQSVMRTFGRDSYPVISFSTDTYGYLSPLGAARIPADLPSYFEKYNINGYYAAGYMFRKYTSSEIRTAIIQSCQRSQGYWLYKMPQLVEPVIPAGEELAGGTQADYLQAIKTANANQRTW
jgi:hypothetical protein